MLDFLSQHVDYSDKINNKTMQVVKYASYAYVYAIGDIAVI